MSSLFIMAGTASKACQHARSLGLQPRSWVFLYSPLQLHGLRDGHVILLPGWKEMPKAEQIMDVIDAQNFSVKEVIEDGKRPESRS